MRMAVSFWTGTGSAPQDPSFPQKQETALSSHSEIRQISGPCLSCVHRIHVPVRRLCKGPGILQIPVSFRHPHGRTAAALHEQAVAKSDRRTVLLEAGYSALYPPALHESLSPLLPVSLSSGSHLRLVQPLQSGTDPLGRRGLHLLRRLSERMSCGTFRPGDLPLSGVHPMRQMCIRMPCKMSASVHTGPANMQIL